MPACASRLLRKYAAPLVAFLGSFLLYALTLAPGVYNLDSAELTTAAATLGIPRATGYPLYVLSGFLWSRLPFWNAGYCLNLYSAFCGALTILLVERILARLDISASIRLGAALLLAASSYFWYLSSIAEVYTLNTALMALLLWRALAWNSAPTRRNLAWFGLAFGLGFTHHGAALLLVPGVAWYLWRGLRAHRLPWSAALGFAACAALPLGLYLYFPLRYLQNPVFNYAGAYDARGQFVPIDLTSLQGLFQLVSAQGFQPLMFGYPLEALWQEILQFWAHLGRSFWLVGIGPGLLGIWALFRRERALAGLLLVTFLCQMLFFSSYRVVDKQTMFLPADLIWALWLATGMQTILRWLEPGRWGRRLARLGLWALVLLAVAWNYPLVNQSQDHSTEEMARSLLEALPPDAVVIGYWNTIPAVQYYQFVEGLRPDVRAVNRFLIGSETLNEFVAWQSQRGVVVFTYYPGELNGQFPLRFEQELYFIGGGE